MLDLFGTERSAPVASLPPALALSLFVAGAERAALDSGRPVSQELARIIAPEANP